MSCLVSLELWRFASDIFNNIVYVIVLFNDIKDYVMGGNALTDGLTRRMSKVEYDERASEVLSLASMSAHFFNIETTTTYKEKETFGDCDVIYCTIDDIPISADIIDSIYLSSEIKVNGPVISFDFREMQVDFIHSKKTEFQYCLSYHNFSDLGNLVGKLFHKFGLKHGHKGLTLPLRDGNHEFAEIQISTDHDAALRFVGLLPERFNQGFNNLQEIFEFVSSSPYYNPDFYKLENLNHIAKIRDKKRSTYNAFLKFGETYTGPVFTDFKRDKAEYLEKIFLAFPDALSAFKQANEKYAARKFLKTKFNGELVNSLTGFTDKQLGQFMQHLKKQFMFSDEMLIFLPVDKISQNILDKVKNFQ